MFSIKQTGVPAGLMLAGVVAPALVVTGGWRLALLVIAGLCLLTVVALQPLRARFDTDRNPAQPLSPADIRANVASVLRDPALRTMCVAMFSFVGLQSLFTGFFVLYLVRGLGYDLERAGLVFAIAVAVAVPARIGWGWLASRLVKPATLLAILGIAMAGAAVLTAFIDPAWPTWARHRHRRRLQRDGGELARRAAGRSGAALAAGPHRRHDRRGTGFRRRGLAGPAAAVQRGAVAHRRLCQRLPDRRRAGAGSRRDGAMAARRSWRMIYLTTRKQKAETS